MLSCCSKKRFFFVSCLFELLAPYLINPSKKINSYLSYSMFVANPQNAKIYQNWQKFYKAQKVPRNPNILYKNSTKIQKVSKIPKISIVVIFGKFFILREIFRDNIVGYEFLCKFAFLSEFILYISHGSRDMNQTLELHFFDVRQ